jgi:hypothetical protein
MLLQEYRSFNTSPLIAEAARKSLKENTSLVVEGVIQRAEAKNQNGRVYPKEILEREIDNYKNTVIAERRALGELDHPDSTVINLNNVCLNMTDVWWEGDDVIGRMEILDTPSGNIVKNLLAAGITIGISSRGMGSVKESRGAVEVQDDFEILCWDIVSNPSTHGAFVSPTQLNESAQAVLNKYNRVESLIHNIICDNTGMCKC